MEFGWRPGSSCRQNEKLCLPSPMLTFEPGAYGTGRAHLHSSPTTLWEMPCSPALPGFRAKLRSRNSKVQRATSHDPTPVHCLCRRAQRQVPCAPKGRRRGQRSSVGISERGGWNAGQRSRETCLRVRGTNQGQVGTLCLRQAHDHTISHSTGCIPSFGRQGEPYENRGLAETETITAIGFL